MRLLSLLAASALLATSFAAPAAVTGNPLSRDAKQPSFLGGSFGQAPLNASTGIGRPVGRYGPVTPVPEPSEWMMLGAGLGIVAFMVRRRARRGGDGVAQ